MDTKWILFEGSFSSSLRGDTYMEEDKARAREIASCLGRKLIEKGFGVMLTSCYELTADAGRSAEEACKKHGINPAARVKTYLYGEGLKTKSGCGMTVPTPYEHWQDVRTHVVTECDAVVGLAGGKGTSDVIQKAMLARKPVFPIGVLDGAARGEWENLTKGGYYNKVKGDLLFLSNFNQTPEELAENIARECTKLLIPGARSKQIFIVHGWDTALATELESFLRKLRLEPIILRNIAEEGRTIFEKLDDELSDVGFGFVLCTPDDFVASTRKPDEPKYRARQNVIFEHGLLIGRLGPGRICTIVKGDIEIPSDLSGVLHKNIKTDQGIDSIERPLIKELLAAGYHVDANDLYREEVNGERYAEAELASV